MNALASKKIAPLLFSLALPAIIAQFVNLLYNIVDRIFIGRMVGGEIAMAGIGISFPIVILIGAFSAFWGIGGAPLCAIEFGAGNRAKAEQIMGNSFSMLVICGAVLTLLFTIFGRDLLLLFGASETTIGYGWDYLSIYLIGTIFTQISLGMNPFINTQGFAKMGMLTVVIGAVVNIVLDPIFIFTFDMGVRGAALATVVAQGVSALWVVLFLVSKKSTLKLKKINLKPLKSLTLKTLSLGVSPFIMQSTEGLVLLTLNAQLARFHGDLAVSAMTIMSSIMQIFFMPLRGLSEGLQPIVSFNFGAKQLQRVRESIFLCFKVAMSYNVVLVTLLLIFPHIFVKIFNSNVALVELTSLFIPIYFPGMIIFGLQMIIQQSFISMGEAKVSVFIAMLRKVFLLVPLAYIIPHFTEDKPFGVLLAEPISDITSVLVSILLFTIFYKKNLAKKLS